jgi:hypothetical protein
MSTMPLTTQMGLKSTIWLWFDGWSCASRFSKVQRFWTLSKPRTELVVRFCTTTKPWTELRTGSEKFRFELWFRTELWHPYQEGVNAVCICTRIPAIQGGWWMSEGSVSGVLGHICSICCILGWVHSVEEVVSFWVGSASWILLHLISGLPELVAELVALADSPPQQQDVPSQQWTNLSWLKVV